jgi:hypothetical protein
MRGLYQPALHSIAAHARIAGLLISLSLVAQNPVRILSISPTAGPEGTRVKVTGQNLKQTSAVLFGNTRSDFKVISSDELAMLVPHKASTSPITVVTPQGRVTSPFAFAVENDSRIPAEVSYKSGYVNSVPPPSDLHSARMWGIAIADTRVPGYESARVEISWTQLSCLANGKDAVLNDDHGNVRGGLFLRHPWFGGHNYHEPLPFTHDVANDAVMLNVGQRGDRVWHFWSPSPRAALAGRRSCRLHRKGACENFSGSSRADRIRLLALSCSFFWLGGK